MEITWIGIIAAAVLLFWLICHKLTSAVKLAIFFLPFGTIAVVNVHWGPGFGVGLDQYFALLLMVSLFSFCVLRKYQRPHLPATVKILFFFLLVSILISWIPLIYNESATIWRHTPSDGFFKAPLVYSIQNITKTVYLLFSMLFFIAIYNSLNLLHPMQIARILIISCMTITISALLDFIPGFSVLWAAMMDNVSYGVVYTGLVGGPLGIPRISGLMAEPSHLIQITLFGLSIIVVFFFRGITVFNRKIDMSILAIFTMASILTYSPVFLGGFFIILGYCLVKSMSEKSVRQRLLKGIVCGSVATSATVLILKYYIGGVNVFYATVVTGLGRLGMAKELAGFSSTFRVQCIQATLETFRASPLVGVGWGGIDLQVGLPFLLLANIGILGFVIFVSLLFLLISISIQKKKRANDIHEYALREGFLLAGFIIMCIFLITKGTLFDHYLPIWFIAAGMIGSYNTSSCQPVSTLKVMHSNVSQIKPCEGLCE